MITKIAITSQNKRTVTEHAGKCRNFFVYEVDEEGNIKKDMLLLEKEQMLHESLHSEGTENPIFNMNMLLTGSIGQGAVQKLAAKGIRAYIIKETDPDTAIEKLIQGTLQAYANAHHHHHDNDHEHEGHGGCGCNCGGGHHH